MSNFVFPINCQYIVKKNSHTHELYSVFRRISRGKCDKISHIFLLVPTEVAALLSILPCYLVTHITIDVSYLLVGRGTFLVYCLLYAHTPQKKKTSFFGLLSFFSYIVLKRIFGKKYKLSAV